MNKNYLVCLCVWPSVLTSGECNSVCEWQRARVEPVYDNEKKAYRDQNRSCRLFLVELNSFSRTTELDFNIKAIKYDINWTVK